MRKPEERLQDILEAIDNIERYASRGREEFERNELIQNLVCPPFADHRRGSTGFA